MLFLILLIQVLLLHLVLFSTVPFKCMTITWYRNDEKPVPSKAYSTTVQSINETTSTLTIPNVTSEDVDIHITVRHGQIEGQHSL